jgi:hypothetical protein
MTTARDARASLEYWTNRVHALQAATYAIALRGDAVDLARHIAELRAAKASRSMVLAELSSRGLLPVVRYAPAPVRYTSTPIPPRRRSVPSRAIATSALVLKSIDAERREIQGMASTPTVDRVGDIVEPLGAKFTLPMSLVSGGAKIPHR